MDVSVIPTCEHLRFYLLTINHNITSANIVFLFRLITILYDPSHASFFDRLARGGGICIERMLSANAGFTNSLLLR